MKLNPQKLGELYTALTAEEKIQFFTHIWVVNFGKQISDAEEIRKLFDPVTAAPVKAWFSLMYEHIMKEHIHFMEENISGNNEIVVSRSGSRLSLEKSTELAMVIQDPSGENHTIQLTEEQTIEITSWLASKYHTKKERELKAMIRRQTDMLKQFVHEFEQGEIKPDTALKANFIIGQGEYLSE